MEQSFAFQYGNQTIPLTVRAGQIDVLDATTPPPLKHLGDAFRMAIEEHVIGTGPLRSILSADDEVTIIISDLTRAWMHQDRICPLLMEYLHTEIGMPYENMLFLVALGAHRPQTESELRALTGDYVFDRVKVINHEADKPLVHIGTTTRGTEVMVNPLVVERKVILMSGTVHHLLAGYGGGRKSILPGVSGEHTIRQNHIHALHPTLPQSSDAVGCGKVLKNPVHEDMMEAAEMVAPLFGINLLVDGNGDHIAFTCGHYARAWEESCRLVDRYNGVPIAEKYDAVIATCGGFPKDLNLYQSSKTMINAYQAIKEGGRLVFFSECSEGGGPAEFFDWSRYQRDGRLDVQLREHFTIAGYIYYACCEIASHTDLHMISSLSEEVLSEMRINGYAAPEAIKPMLDFGEQRVAIMPHGSSTVPILKKS